MPINWARTVVPASIGALAASIASRPAANPYSATTSRLAMPTTPAANQIRPTRSSATSGTLGVAVAQTAIEGSASRVRFRDDFRDVGHRLRALRL